MDRRLKKVERVLAVQKQLHRLADWELASLDREKAELAAGETALVSALNGDDNLQGLFIESMARRLKALAIEAERLNQSRKVVSARLTEAGLSVKRTERMTAKLKREMEAEIGKRGFADLLDRLGQPDDASLP